MKRLSLFILLLLLLGGCSWLDSGQKTKPRVADLSPASLNDGFLWQRLDEGAYVSFAANMHCNSGTVPGYSEGQLKLLTDVGLTPARYDFELKRPDWFTEYAKTGLESKVSAMVDQKCGGNN